MPQWIKKPYSYVFLYLNQFAATDQDIAITKNERNQYKKVWFFLRKQVPKSRCDIRFQIKADCNHDIIYPLRLIKIELCKNYSSYICDPMSQIT